MDSGSSSSYPHTSIHEMLRRLQQVNSPTPRKVTILGAGISGLVAARELEALGRRVISRAYEVVKE